jgi:spore coat protein A, manganese oxidase
MKETTMPLSKWATTLQRLQSVPQSIGSDGVHESSLSLRALDHAFHPDVTTRTWSYVNTASGAPGLDYAGALIDVTPGQGLRVNWRNELVGEKLLDLLAFGPRIGMEEHHMLTVPHNQIHLHGARVPGSSDGNPMHHLHPRESRGYHYPNNQPASTLWFHDHAMDVTRLNVYAGLYGLYILRDPGEAAALPSGAFEVGLVLQDKTFDLTNPANPKMFYEQAIDAAFVATPEFEGEYPVVNGKVWPVMTASPTFYRFRMVNGANARIFKRLAFFEESDPTAFLFFDVVGVDGGFIKPPDHRQIVSLAPGERLDVVIDLSALGGKNIIFGDTNQTDHFAELIKITLSSTGASSTYNKALIPVRADLVTDGHFPDPTDYPTLNATVTAIPEATKRITKVIPGVGKVVFRKFVLEESIVLEKATDGLKPGTKVTVAVANTDAAFGQMIEVPMISVNGKQGRKIPNIKIEQDALEVWEFINRTVDTHPMHIHLVQFQILGRVKTDGTNAAISEYEKGWKDTIQCKSMQSTRVLMRFDGASGEYVFHCHILEHEDMGMMGNMTVDPQ